MLSKRSSRRRREMRRGGGGLVSSSGSATQVRLGHVRMSERRVGERDIRPIRCHNVFRGSSSTPTSPLYPAVPLCPRQTVGRTKIHFSLDLYRISFHPIHIYIYIYKLVHTYIYIYIFYYFFFPQVRCGNTSDTVTTRSYTSAL